MSLKTKENEIEHRYRTDGHCFCPLSAPSISVTGTDLSPLKALYHK